MAEPFWRTKTLDEMSAEEWESLCDGCGRCCLNKLEDMDSGAIAFTDVACVLLDAGTCRCKDYGRRFDTVPDCMSLSPGVVVGVTWLPPSCAYRRVAEGRDLAWWHHLVCGDRDAVHTAGVSVRGRVVSETDVEADRYEERLVEWPGEDVLPE